VAEGRCFIAEAKPHTEAPQSVFAPAAAELAVSSCCAVFVAFDTDEAKGGGEVLRHYTCRALPSLDIGGLAAVLLAFAQECAPAQDACGRPLGCVIDAGPFNGAGLGAEAGEGSDVEPRMAKALAASNFARGNAPPLRVYRVP